jgi:hypothetical protein
MDERRERRVNAVVGVFLLVITIGALVFGGGIRDLLAAPITAAQLGLLGAAGVCNVVAATRTPLTGWVYWYQWGGVGNVLLGGSMLVRVLDPGAGAGLTVATGAVGLLIAAMGVDLAVFRGQYTRGEPHSEA